MGGEVFPPFDERDVESRVTNFCGTVQKKYIITTTNAATLLYKMPTKGDTFKVKIHHNRHPKRKSYFACYSKAFTVIVLSL